MYRQTTFAFVLALVACVESACGGSSSPSAPTPAPAPAPIAPAALSTPAGAVLNAVNNCEAAMTLARLTGIGTAQCAFTAVLVHTGTGCAINVSGTATASRDTAGSQQTG